MTIQETLKEREIEVLRLMAQGMSNREIAEKLYIGVETVKWYAKNIYSKLDVANRKEAARKADELGLLSDTSTADSQNDIRTYNLPTLATPFLGREQEIKQVASLLKNNNNRVVTILASGGMGKTRLSIEVAHRMLDDFRDGVFFVALAPLSSADDIVTTIVDVLGFNIRDSNIIEQLIEALKERSILLILDNFEHLLRGVTLVADIIKDATNIKILVTSRERLNIYGEHVYHLRGMSFPTWETPNDTLDYDAVRLFLQSARRNRADFDLHSDDLDFLARICKLTEGMPLGIELAAGWVDILSLEQIADEIQKGINIFETELRDVPERHRSLSATFEQTWRRLSKREQQAFMKLSIFRGGFTLESAQTVADTNPRILQKLAQKALIQFTDQDRFTVHELVRQFGAVKLEEIGNLKVVSDSHARYFTEFAYDREHDLKNGRQLQAFIRLDSDFENMRVAWHHLSDHHQWELLLKYRYTLWFYCDLRSRSQDAMAMFDYTLHILNQLPETATVTLTKGRILAWQSWDDHGHDQELRRQRANSAISILEGKDEALEDIIIAYHTLHSIAINRVASLTSAKHSHALAKKLGDFTWLGQTAIFTVFLAADTHIERELLDQAWYYFKTTGDVHGLWLCSIAEGVFAYIQGELDASIELFKIGFNYIAPLNSAWHISGTHRSLGLLYLQQGKLDEAEYHYLLSLSHLWRVGEGVWYQLMRLIKIHMLKGQYDIAVAITHILDDIPVDWLDQNHDERNLMNDQIRYADIRDTLEQHLIDRQLKHLWKDIKKPILQKLVHQLLNDFEKRFPKTVR